MVSVEGELQEPFGTRLAVAEEIGFGSGANRLDVGMEKCTMGACRPSWRAGEVGFSGRRRRWRGPCIRRASILLPGRRMQGSPQPSRPVQPVRKADPAEKSTKIPLKGVRKADSAEKSTKIPLKGVQKADPAEKSTKIPLEGVRKADPAEKSTKIPQNRVRKAELPSRGRSGRRRRR